jgi:hypothetical protein
MIIDKSTFFVDQPISAKPIIPLFHHFYPVKLFSISPGPLFQL